MVNALSSSMTTLQGTVAGLSSSKADTTAVSALSSSVETLEGTVADLLLPRPRKPQSMPVFVHGNVARDCDRPLRVQGRQGHGGHPVFFRETLEGTVSDLSASKADKAAVDTLSSSVATLQSTATANGDDIASSNSLWVTSVCDHFGDVSSRRIESLARKVEQSGESVSSLTIQIGRTSRQSHLHVSIGRLDNICREVVRRNCRCSTQT